MREEQFGDARLILGDCREALEAIEAADALISDPPFEKEAHTLGRRLSPRGASRGGQGEVMVPEVLSFSAITDDLRGYVANWAAERVCGWALAFCQAEAVAAWRAEFEAAGAKYKRSMVWIKPDGMPQYNGQMPGMGYESIAAAWCGPGTSRWNGGGRHGVFTFNKNSGGKHEHETQKPLPLMRSLVSLFTDPGALVIDPFAGSSSTGVACIELGRRFIGVEIEQKYFDVSCRRLESASKQPRLFMEPPMKQVKLEF